MADKERSTCDILKQDTSKIMKKMDSQIPLYVKIYSDIYREYNHTVEDFFNLGYALERAELNAMFQGTGTKKTAEILSRLYTDMLLSQLDLYEKFLKWYAQTRISGLKSTDSMIHNFMEYAGVGMGGVRESSVEQT